MKRYPEYKDSGLEWLGEIPTTWTVMPLVGVARERTETNKGMVEANLLSLSYGRIVPKDIEGLDGLLPASFETYQIVHPLDIVMRLTDLQNDKRSLRSAIVTRRGIITSAYLALHPNQIDAEYLGYLLRAYDLQKVFYSMGGGLRQSMKFSDMKRLPVLSPPLPEQHAIADFLDRETAKIDALVEEQRHLIALLAEKRQAVISHAVTKGLNPTAPLKPSGIDWLGDIPEGWEVCRLKDDLAFLTSGSRGWAEYYSDNGALFLRIGNLTRDQIGLDIEDIQRVEVPLGAEGERTRVRAKDLLFSITAFLGSVAVIPNELEEAYVSQHVALARLRQTRLLPEWVAYVTLSAVGKNYLASQGYGGTKIQLSLSDIGNLVVPVPSMAEQSELVASIELKLAHLAALAKTATLAISLLQERRAALISTAVTGKIDPRNMVAPVVAPHQLPNVSAMVAGIVIAKLGRQPDHGRIWLQKMLFMAQTHANIDGIGGHYLRAANGPLDIGLRDQVEADLSAADAIRVTREPGEKGAYHYDFIGDATQLRADLEAEIGDRMDGFLRLMDLLGDMGTKQIEAVATLYAAWNDFLIDGKAPSDADLIHEVRENWHPAKKERLSSQYLADQLGWMRRQDIVPSGSGRKTYTDRLL